MKKMYFLLYLFHTFFISTEICSGSEVEKLHIIAVALYPIVAVPSYPKNSCERKLNRSLRELNQFNMAKRFFFYEMIIQLQKEKIFKILKGLPKLMNEILQVDEKYNNHTITEEQYCENLKSFRVQIDEFEKKMFMQNGLYNNQLKIKDESQTKQPLERSEPEDESQKTQSYRKQKLENVLRITINDREKELFDKKNGVWEYYDTMGRHNEKI